MIRRLVLTATLALSLSGCASIRNFFFGNDVINAGNKLTITTFPARSSNASDGRSFMRTLTPLSLETREEAILKELRRGNIPEYQRTFRKVNLPVMRGIGLDHIKEAYIWVASDYLAVGSNRDSVRVPMNPITAQKLADQFGCILPTAKMVDLIYRAAETKLPPAPKPPGPQMTSIPYYLEHQSSIQSQLGGDRFQGKLVAGHKKDIVLTNRLATQPRKVAIYGWHRLNGRPIQPVSLVHGIHYADYSHGLRLVYGQMVINGSSMAVRDVLRDAKLSALLSNEGPLRVLRVDGGGFPSS